MSDRLRLVLLLLLLMHGATKAWADGEDTGKDDKHTVYYEYSIPIFGTMLVLFVGGLCICSRWRRERPANAMEGTNEVDTREHRLNPRIGSQSDLLSEVAPYAEELALNTMRPDISNQFHEGQTANATETETVLSSSTVEKQASLQYTASAGPEASACGNSDEQITSLPGFGAQNLPSLTQRPVSVGTQCTILSTAEVSTPPPLPPRDYKRLPLPSGVEQQQERDDGASQRTTRITSEELSSLNTMHLPEHISTDYQSIISYRSTRKQNMQKDRYMDTVVYDKNRVKLVGLEDDYINASYINDANGMLAYIAAQGPMPATFCDFWYMVWQEKVTVIANMTKCREGNRIKCSRYWPGKATGYDIQNPGKYGDDVGQKETYGNITVSIERSELLHRAYVHTKMSLTHCAYPDQTHAVHHYWFLNWPDHGVPESTDNVVDFVEEWRGSESIVLHCSAGVGRTGTIAALDIAWKELEEKQSVDVKKIVEHLRLQRHLMVQTTSQYEFIYRCLQHVQRTRVPSRHRGPTDI